MGFYYNYVKHKELSKCKIHKIFFFLNRLKFLKFQIKSLEVKYIFFTIDMVSGS